MKFSKKDKNENIDQSKSKSKNKVIEVKAIEDHDSTAAVKEKRPLNFKLIGMIAGIIAVVIITIVIIVNYRSAEGERYAENARGYIGNSVQSLNNNSDIYYADGSSYNGVNTAVTFDYIAESSKSVRAGGVKYPAWAVTLKTDKNGGFISEVTYTDFSTLKHDMRGSKTDALIDLNKFAEGERKNTVLREIPVRPYSISLSQTGIMIYTYKYWYKTAEGDEQAAILRAGFSEKGDYKYSATELLIPRYM